MTPALFPFQDSPLACDTFFLSLIFRLLEPAVFPPLGRPVFRHHKKVFFPSHPLPPEAGPPPNNFSQALFSEVATLLPLSRGDLPSKVVVLGPFFFPEILRIVSAASSAKDFFRKLLCRRPFPFLRYPLSVFLSPITDVQ